MKAFFVFSGQGAQTVGMGKDLYDSSAAARKVFDEADEVLGYKLSDIIFNGPIEKLTESVYCQDAIYTTSCAALAAFKEKFGDITPVACAGLSLGEYGALYCAGAFDFATGAKLLAARGKLMDEACRKTEGAMASVLGGDPDVRSVFSGVPGVVEHADQTCDISRARLRAAAGGGLADWRLCRLQARERSGQGACL